MLRAHKLQCRVIDSHLEYIQVKHDLKLNKHLLKMCSFITHTNIYKCSYIVTTVAILNYQAIDIKSTYIMAKLCALEQ